MDLVKIKPSSSLISGSIRSILFTAVSSWLSVPAGSGYNSLGVGNGPADIARAAVVVASTRDGAQALQKAIQSCSARIRCQIDARNPSIGIQTFTVNPFANVDVPVTIYSGAYTIQWDVNDRNAVAVDLPSDLKWVLGGTTIRPTLPQVAIPQSAFLKDTAGHNANDGGSGQGMLNARVFGLNGNIQAGTNVLTVSDTRNLRIGMAIAVLGGAGPVAGQQTVLNGDITETTTELTVTSVAGFPRPGSSDSTIPGYNYIVVDDEIIGWNGIDGNVLQNLGRGLLGTTSAHHRTHSTVAALGTLVTDIVDIRDSQVMLRDKSQLSLNDTQIQAGAADISIEGRGNIDGNYFDRTVAPPGNVAVSGVFCYLCSSMTIGKDVRFMNLQHSGVFISGGRHNRIAGHYQHIGRPLAYGSGLGADIVLFGNASENLIRSSSHADGNFMVLIDDRSASFSRLSGASNDNQVIVGPQLGANKYNSGVGIEGYSSRNSITVGKILVTGTAPNAALYVDATSQWPTAAPIPSDNRFTFDTISSDGAAIRTANYSSSTSKNRSFGGRILSGAVKAASASDTVLTNSGKKTARSD